MQMLDWTRSYAVISGLPGAAYEQDGRKFKTNGMEVLPSDLEPIPDPEEVDDGPEINPPSVSCIEIHTPESNGADKPLAEMDWKHLKVLVESFGGEYKNKEQAVGFLSGKHKEG